MKSEKTNTNSDSRGWQQLLSLIPQKQLMLSLFYGGSRIAISTAWPFFLYRTLKEIGISSSNQIITNISIVVFMLALLAGATHLQSKINIQVLKLFTLELIDRIWKKMNSLDWLTFHGKNRVYYFDMLMVETWRLRAGMSAIIESLIVNSLIAFTLSLFIIFISWQLFLVFFCGLLIMGLGHFISTLKTRPLLKQFHKAWRAQHLWVAKCVDQFDLIKLDRAYEASADDNIKNSTLFLDANSRLLFNQAKWRNINQQLGNIVRIGVFIIGIYWVRIEILNLDDLLLSLLVVSIVQASIMQLPSAINSLIEAQESLKTVLEFFDLKDEQADTPQVLSEFAPIDTISISNLSYSYGNKDVITNLNIILKAGNIYLWRGSNGSGKSTAAHILLGLLHPKEGSLKINGEVKDWKELRLLRNRFAFLNQDSPIFMGSLKENILFGHTDPSGAIHTLHNTWLSGLLPISDQAENRIVGEKGEGLSGGEAKRVALIRELLRSSELIILDEPLNHLDEFAIQEIKREILSIKSNAIIVIISHQAGFESIADEIKQF